MQLANSTLIASLHAKSLLKTSAGMQAMSLMQSALGTAKKNRIFAPIWNSK